MAKQQKAKASTQDHLDLDDVVDDLVIMKNGWVALVLTTTAVNFDLLSEAEQDATIYAFGAFLNSLTFPVQILIRSKKADITSYFASLEEAENSQPNPDLKRQIQKYKDFIQSTVQQKTVLDKKFYLIINFSPMELGLKGLGKKQSTQKSKSQLIADSKAALMPKRDHIIKQTARLGLITKQLTTQELIELFYDIYNPAPTGTQRVLLDNASYTTPIVEPALEVPSPAPQQSVENAQSTEQNVPNGNTPRVSELAQEPELRPAPKASPIQPNQLPTTNYQLPTATPTSGLDLRQNTQPAQQTPPPIEANPLPTTNLGPQSEGRGPHGTVSPLPTDLRPVPPPPQAAPSSFAQNSKNTQSAALQGLQEVTARAAQMMNRPLPSQQPSNVPNPPQPVPNIKP